MNTFWLLGKGDSTKAISQLSFQAIEQWRGMDDSPKEIGTILEENFENNHGVSTDKALQNGPQAGTEDHNQNIIREYERNGCGVAQSNGHTVSSNGKLERPREGQARKSTDNLSTSSLVDSKRYLQLETLSKKGGALKLKKKNSVQSSTCVIL